MASFDYARWHQSMRELLAQMMDVFEARMGYPHGRNLVVEAGGDLVGEEASLVLPEPLLEFYRHIKEVSLPDVHVGYFVHPLEKVVAGLDGRVPVRIEGRDSREVVTFGSDGGGVLFALGRDQGAPVYLIPTGLVQNGAYIDNESRVQIVAPTLPTFLDKVREMLHFFVIGDYSPNRYIS